MRILAVAEYMIHLIYMMPAVEGLRLMTGGSSLYRCSASSLDRRYTDAVSPETLSGFLEQQIIVTGEPGGDYSELFEIADEYAPDVIFWWNGFLGGEAVLAEMAKTCPIVYCEVGFFPQHSHLYMDRKGINLLSSIRERTSPDITPAMRERLERKIADWKASAPPDPPSFAERDYIFLPLQLENDTQISLFSPHFKRMPDLVDFVSRQFPGERIVVKPHPLDTAEYESGCSNVIVEKGVSTHVLIRNSKAVVGINSTVLLEAVLYGKRVAALGLGIFSGKGVMLDAHEDPEAVKGLLAMPADESARENFLHDLMFNCQMYVGSLNEKGFVDRPGIDPEALAEWYHRNLEGDTAPREIDAEGDGDRPLVSVIVACGSESPYLGEAVRSVIGQTLESWELLIVSGASEEAARDVVSEFASGDERVRHIRIEPPHGLSAARNRGIEESRGRYLQFLDASDFLREDKLALQVDACGRMPGTAVAYSAYYNCMPHGKAVHMPLREKSEGFDRKDPLRDMAYSWESGKFAPPGAFLFDADLFRDTGLRFDESLGRYADWDCWLRVMTLRPHLCHQREKLAYHRPPVAPGDSDTREMLQVIEKQKFLHRGDRVLQAVFDLKREMVLGGRSLEETVLESAAPLEPCETAVTVAVCAFNQADRLPVCVRSIYAQRTGFSFDVLVVDNDSTGATRRCTSELQEEFPGLRYTHEPRHGDSHARNRALNGTSARTVAFIDGEAAARQGWLQALCTWLSGPVTACAGGAVFLDLPRDKPAWLTLEMESLLGRFCTETEYVEVEQVSACGFAVNRAACLDVGGFAAERGPCDGAALPGEVSDLCRRLRAAGYRVVYKPDAQVCRHIDRSWLTRDWFAHRMRLQGIVEMRAGERPGGAEDIVRYLREVFLLRNAAAERTRAGDPDGAIANELAAARVQGYLDELLPRLPIPARLKLRLRARRQAG